jgi:hypothetical protein
VNGQARIKSRRARISTSMRAVCCPSESRQTLHRLHAVAKGQEVVRGRKRRPDRLDTRPDPPNLIQGIKPAFTEPEVYDSFDRYIKTISRNSRPPTIFLGPQLDWPARWYTLKSTRFSFEVAL